jgi:type II secretory pathway pseudopilin PulG
MRRNAFTLIEVLVSAVLLVLLMGLIQQVLVPALHTWVRSDERSQAEQSTLVVVARLRDEVRASNPDTTVVTQSGQLQLYTWQAAGSGMTWNCSGDLMWQRRVVVYLQNGDVRISETPINPAPPRGCPPGVACPAQIVLPSFTPIGTDDVLAHHVTALTFTAQGGGTVLLDVEAQVGNATSELQTTLSPTANSNSCPSPSPSPCP